MSLVTALLRTSAALCAALLVVALSPPVGTAAAPATPVPAPTGSPAGPPAAAAARWAVQPSSPKGPTGRNYFIYDLAPGSTLTDHVGVTNLSDRPLTFDVYGTDAYTTTDGAFSLLPAARPPTDVGSWIRFDRRSWTIQPGHRTDIPFRLSVPHNATPGDHAGGVIGSIAQARTTAEGQRVRVDQRLAARVYLRVTGPVQPAVTIDSVTVSYDNPVNPFGRGETVVSYRVRNTGNVRVGGSATVTVAGPFGWELARTDPADLPELLPGGSFTVTEKITGVPPAIRLTAEVDLAATTPDTALPPVLRSAAAWAPPWLLLALLAAAAGWTGLRRWRRHPAAAGKVAPDPGAAGNVTLVPGAATATGPTAPPRPSAHPASTKAPR